MTPPILGSDNVRAVLARFPATSAVFERHGLLGCGGKSGPDERIDLFARVHQIDLLALLDALNAARLESSGPEAPVLPEAAPIYPPFLKTALVATLSLGATFGAYNLLWIHLALGPLPPSHNVAHAGFQLFGFVLLFIMGVSYHAFPRMSGVELRRRGVARSTLWSAIGALVLVCYGRFGAFLPGTSSALLLGSLLELLTVSGWAWVLASTARASKARDPYLRFSAAGTGWWIVSAALLVVSAWRAFGAGDADLASASNEAIYAAALFGGALSWIQGMILRTGPAFLAVPSDRPRIATLSFVFGQAGALLLVIGRARLGEAGGSTLTSFGLIATAVSVFALLLAVQPFRRAEPEPAGPLADFRWMIQLASSAGILFCALAVAYALIDLTGGAATKLMFDGARHAFALGFVTLTIFAYAGRVLPIFGGVDLRHPRLRSIGGYLIAAGVLLREAQVGAALGADPRLMIVSGVSGVVAATGVVLCSISIWSTLGANRRAEKEETDLAPLAADTNVARLLESHPEALSILIEGGFAPLANPILRNTMARAVTLAQACRMHGIPVEPLLERLRQSCSHQPRSRPGLKVLPD
jgi:hypothetical protein